MYMTTGVVALVGDGIILGFGMVSDILSMEVLGSETPSSEVLVSDILSMAVSDLTDLVLDLIDLVLAMPASTVAFTAHIMEEASMDVVLIEVLPLIDLEEDIHQEQFQAQPYVQVVPI